MSTESKTFALIGAAGFVAPRHIEAIHRVGGELVAALDPHDSVGVLDRYFPDCRFFTSPERFEHWLSRRVGEVDYVVVCSPNWLHHIHCRWALRAGADAICEKPVVLNPRTLDELEQLERDTGKRVHPVLQLRCHPAVEDLLHRVDGLWDDGRVAAELTYVTRRGSWYASSWKGDRQLSGGLLMNLGIHFFDLACLLFGTAHSWKIARDSDPTHASGCVDFGRSSLVWSVSTREQDLPESVRQRGGHAYRSLVVNGEPIDFSEGFEDLHTKVYRNVLAGIGPRLAQVRPSIKLVHLMVNNAP